MKNLPRVLEIIWLLIAAVSVFEAFVILSSKPAEKTSGYLFIIVAVFASFRYFMLKRKRFKAKKKSGDFD